MNACSQGEKRKMGKGTREKEVWGLEKETKGCWQEKKEKEHL